jgi:hypothetical protein
MFTPSPKQSQIIEAIGLAHRTDDPRSRRLAVYMPRRWGKTVALAMYAASNPDAKLRYVCSNCDAELAWARMLRIFGRHMSNMRVESPESLLVSVLEEGVDDDELVLMDEAFWMDKSVRDALVYCGARHVLIGTPMSPGVTKRQTALDVHKIISFSMADSPPNWCKAEDAEARALRGLLTRIELL